MAAATQDHPQVNKSALYTSSLGGPSPPETYNFGKGVYASPMSQTPPSNISPTNWSSHANVRQLRQPRQPLYVPAALRPTDTKLPRPTDIPGHPRAPDTPPASKDNSFDGGKFNTSPSMVMDGLPRMDSFHGNDMEVLRRGLSRAASESLDEELGTVTGEPTTAHWKPDTTATDCAICHRMFTWYFRRHHCRRCGGVVCENHVSKRVPLDQNARLHPDGTDSKACDPCWQEWLVVKKLRHSRTNSIAESQSSQGTTMPALAIPHQAKMLDEARVGSMARSEGMVWSTF
ncbi:hypothetical protein LTR08_000910 [Meristemomyces frigidus]|nr:hypothetical protein LTR08_000910 [Meristemomyces frigidus]